MTYTPGVIAQLQTSPFGSTNCCVCSAVGGALDQHDGQKPAGVTEEWPPSVGRWRVLTGRQDGNGSFGTNLNDNDRVAREHKGSEFDIRRAIPFEDFWAEARAGRGFILQGAYSGLPRQYRGSETFLGNHAIRGYADERFSALIFDSLHDGRRPGIPRGPIRIPKAALLTYAGELVIGKVGNDPIRLGNGRAYVAFFDAGETKPEPPIRVELGRNVMLVLTPGTVTTAKRKAVKKGTPILREPGGPVVTRMSRDSRIPYVGYAGSVDGVGYQAVLVGTRNFPDGQPRTVMGFVRFDAGPVS